MQPVILLIYQYDYREVLSASPIIHLLLSHEAVKPNQTKTKPLISSRDLAGHYKRPLPIKGLIPLIPLEDSPEDSPKKT